MFGFKKKISLNILLSEHVIIKLQKAKRRVRNHSPFSTSGGVELMNKMS